MSHLKVGIILMIALLGLSLADESGFGRDHFDPLTWFMERI